MLSCDVLEISSFASLFQMPGKVAGYANACSKSPRHVIPPVFVS